MKLEVGISKFAFQFFYHDFLGGSIGMRHLILCDHIDYKAKLRLLSLDFT